MPTRKSLQEVIRLHRDRIMKVPGVIGVAGGLCPSRSGQKCVLVYALSDARPRELPKTLNGYPVEIVVKSRGFRAL